jgi:hypothetical protein
VDNKIGNYRLGMSVPPAHCLYVAKHKQGLCDIRGEQAAAWSGTTVLAAQYKSLISEFSLNGNICLASFFLLLTVNW